MLLSHAPRDSNPLHVGLTHTKQHNVLESCLCSELAEHVVTTGDIGLPTSLLRERYPQVRLGLRVVHRSPAWLMSSLVRVQLGPFVSHSCSYSQHALASFWLMSSLMRL